jgi:hypothetical protein
MTFAGFHKSLTRDETVVVFRVDDDWYWQRVERITDTKMVPISMIYGPYLTDDDAYTAATTIGD